MRALALALAACASAGVSESSSAPQPLWQPPPERRRLPDGPLIAGYAPRCDASVTRAVEQGVNVVYWFASSLLYNASAGAPYVSYGGPDLGCVASLAAQWRARGLRVAHLLSVGGWDAPHVETQTPAAALHAAWRQWNERVASRPGLEGGFDGVDWDLEGADDPASVTNALPAPQLDAVGEFSRLEKAAGFLVSMVPPESYLDPTTPAFDTSLLHAYPDGAGPGAGPWQPNFTYHGHNPYAYLLSRYGETAMPGGGVEPTFDVILLQLYETFSHLTYNLTQLRQPAADYLERWVPMVVDGWHVDFGSCPNVSWPSATVRVPADRLLVGFGNGWTGGAGDRNALVLPAQIGDAHERLRRRGMAPRGYFFWSIPQEGITPPNSTEPLYFAQGLNAFLHVRDVPAN